LQPGRFVRRLAQLAAAESVAFREHERVPSRKDTWIAAGYSGHGNVLGFMCGELVASALQGREDPLLELFVPARLLVSG
jgi:hypothetical protein